MVVPEQQQIATRPAAPPPVAAVDQVAPRAAAESSPEPQAAPKETEARSRKADADDNSKKLQARSDAARDNRQQQLKDAPSLKEEVAVAQPAAAPPPASPAAIAATGQRAEAPARAAENIVELQKSARLAFASREIGTPDPSRRWRIADRGIERSNDAGATWTLVRAATGESLTSGAAPSGSVLWLVGQAGVVVLTTDGVNFTRVDLPERVDLAGIAAVDARTATVTTADGRRFETGDGGRSWRRIQA
jgi:hypothetical protein